MIEPELDRKLQHLAWRAHTLLGALDVSRTDIRLDAEGNPRLLEINTLPGLTPGYSDLCLQATAEGMSYEDLILEILYLAAGRWGLAAPRTDARAGSGSIRRPTKPACYNPPAYAIGEVA